MGKLYEVPAVVVDGKLYLSKDGLIEYLQMVDADPKVVNLIQRGRQTPGTRRFMELPPDHDGRSD